MSQAQVTRDPAVQHPEPRVWVETSSLGPSIVGHFLALFGDEPLAQMLVAVDHQLSTDSDLEEITGAARYRALRQEIRTVMAQKLGFQGYRDSRTPDSN